MVLVEGNALPWYRESWWEEEDEELLEVVMDG